MPPYSAHFHCLPPPRLSLLPLVTITITITTTNQDAHIVMKTCFLLSSSSLI
jgi:hypothetical protein